MILILLTAVYWLLCSIGCSVKLTEAYIDSIGCSIKARMLVAILVVSALFGWVVFPVGVVLNSIK